MRPLPTTGTLGPSYQRRHESWVSLWGPVWAHVVVGTPHGEVRNAWGCLIVFYVLNTILNMINRSANGYSQFMCSRMCGGKDTRPLPEF